MSELPTELVIEILARVPVKSLFRFRCVCKSWKSLFYDRLFIRKQTTHAPSRILFVDYMSPYEPPTIYTCEDHKLEMISEEPELNVNNKLIKTIIGPCDGLFCLNLADESFALWNPTLRELRKVLTIKEHQIGSVVGFGYDHSIQDHKIVLIPIPLQPSDKPLINCSKAQVLAVKSGVTRMIDFPWRKDWVGSTGRGILVGENIFWLLRPSKESKHTIEISEEDILTFNVVSETFYYLSSPGSRYEKRVSRDLYMLRGSLCAVDGERGESGYNYLDIVVWCAEHEKGRIKSWRNILKPKASIINKATCWKVYWYELLTVLSQARSLLIKVVTWEGGPKLFEYNLEEGTMTMVKNSSPIQLFLCGVMNEYIATLVPA